MMNLDMRDFTGILHEFRQLQLERRRDQLKKKKVRATMEKFENVLVEGTRNRYIAKIYINEKEVMTILPIELEAAVIENIRPDDIETFDSNIDNVTINLRNGRNHLIIFGSAEETNRFVVSLRVFLEFSNPEENAAANADPPVVHEANQDPHQDEDSGRDSVLGAVK